MRVRLCVDLLGRVPDWTVMASNGTSRYVVAALGTVQVSLPANESIHSSYGIVARRQHTRTGLRNKIETSQSSTE